MTWHRHNNAWVARHDDGRMIGWVYYRFGWAARLEPDINGEFEPREIPFATAWGAAAALRRAVRRRLVDTMRHRDGSPCGAPSTCHRSHVHRWIGL